jgi:hypothetical protein
MFTGFTGSKRESIDFAQDIHGGGRRTPISAAAGW